MIILILIGIKVLTGKDLLGIEWQSLLELQFQPLAATAVTQLSSNFVLLISFYDGFLVNLQ